MFLPEETAYVHNQIYRLFSMKTLDLQYVDYIKN